MKRKSPPAGSEGTATPETRGSGPESGPPALGPDSRRKRQPQVSCDFCRSKKLKCDRRRPCSNCVARGQECRGGPVVIPAPAILHSEDILARLQRLEQAVFDGIDEPAARRDGAEPGGIPTGRPKAAEISLGQGGHLPTPSSTDLDYPSVGQAQVSVLLAPPALRHRTRLSCHVNIASKQPNNSRICVAEPMNQYIVTGNDRLERLPLPSVLLPSKTDAMTMLDYFLQVSHCIPLTIHVPFARWIISQFYSNLACAQASGRRGFDMAHAAFIFSICATAAFFWNADTPFTAGLFASVGDAEGQAHSWLNAAWDLLDQLSRAQVSGSLEEVQAYLVLSDLIYNIEGCSNRERYLHNRALTVSRAISLHLIDAPGQEATADQPEMEVRRRVWWHIASTDWLLSTMGGPQDRTYQVQPQHMLVEFPRNANNADILTALPDDVTTDMTYFILRTRLAEVCRKVTDLLPLGGPAISQLPYQQAAAISKLFTDLMTSMPPGFALDAPIEPEYPSGTSVNRQVIHLAFHARVARIFRPFLLDQDEGPNFDLRCIQFRFLCLRSARSVLQIASDLLRESLDRKALGPSPPMHRSGCVVSHLFMACVVLATDPRLGPEGKTNGACESDEVDEIRRELADARRLMEQLSKQSPIAAGLVGKLVGVLKRYAPATGARQRESHPAHFTPTSTIPVSSSVPATSIPSPASGGTPRPIEWEVQTRGELPEQHKSNSVNARHVQISEGDARDSINWDFGAGMWDGMEWDALMGATLTGTNSWSDVFADLDATFSASV